MPAVNTTPPKPGTYQYVAYLPRLEVMHSIEFHAYDETCVTVAVQHPGQPCPRHTIFIKRKTTLERAVRMGWVDVTEQWQQALLDARPKLSTVSQRKVYHVLTDEPQTKADLLEASGIPDSEWRTTIKLLEERGLVRVKFEGRKRSAASNRSYRYVRGKRWAEALDVAPMELASGTLVVVGA